MRFWMIVRLLPVLALASCATSSSSSLDHQADNQAVVKPTGRVMSDQETHTIVERRSVKQMVIITNSCNQNAVEGSDIAAIRKRVQKDLADAGLSDQEIRDQLALYDSKTCDLR